VRPKDIHQTTLLSNPMSKQVLITLLKQGNTGEEILSILDAITADFQAEEV
jgi:hypothetical protein